MKKTEPKSVQELERIYKNKKESHSTYTLIFQFLKGNDGKAYKISQLQEELNMTSNSDYWNVRHACRFLVQDGLITSFGTNPAWYAYRKG